MNTGKLSGKSDEILGGGVTLKWTSMPSKGGWRGSGDTRKCIMLRKLG